MLYSKEVIIPPNTAKADYQEDTLGLTKGIITRIAVFFPWGCAGLVYVQIIRRTWQIFPLSREEWLNGNDRAFDFKTNIELSSEPFEIIIRSYNEDDTYLHRPIVSVEMIKGTIPERFRLFMRELGG